MKHLIIVAVVCLAVVSAVFASDFQGRIAQLQQERQQRVEYINKLQNEIIAQTTRVNQIDGALAELQGLVEKEKADTQPKEETK